MGDSRQNFNSTTRILRLRANRGGGKSDLVRLTVKGDGKVLHENVTQDHWDTVLALDTQAVLVGGVTIVVEIVQQILGTRDSQIGGTASREGQRRELGNVAGGHGNALTLEEGSAARANTRELNGAAHSGELLLKGLHDTIGNDQESGSRVDDNLVLI